MSRIVFMGTPAFAVPSLQQLIQSQEVIGVVTQPDRPAGRGRQLQASPIKEKALETGLPLYQPVSLRKPETAERLRQWAPELIVVAAYGQILRPHVLDIPANGCLNVHASLLPRWRGASPIQHAILAGDERSGISLMQMDEGLDTGPVYFQESLAIGPAETASTLHDRLALLGAELLGRHLDNILTGLLVASPQDEKLATYAPLIQKQDGVIDWRQNSSQLERQIRAMTPWPGAFTTWQGQGLKILAARTVDTGPLPSGPPGTVVVLQDTAVVLTGDGGLRLENIHLAGKRPTTGQDFLRGRPDFAGAQLGS